MLIERIKILEDANIISKDVADFVLKVIDLLEEYGFDDSKMEMFTTHLAMATQRTLDKNEELIFDQAIWTQIESDINFTKALELYNEISSYSPAEYLESEQKFLIMHVCNLHQD